MTSKTRWHQKPLATHDKDHSFTSGEGTVFSAEVGHASGRTSVGSSHDEERGELRRDPDIGNLQPFHDHDSFSILIIHATDNVHITSTTPRSGKVETHNHKSSRYDPTEPRSSVATDGDYFPSHHRPRDLRSGRSGSQSVRTAPDTPIGSETKLSGARKSAIPVESFESLHSTAGEGTIEGSIQRETSMTDIQDLLLAEAALNSSDLAAMLANFSENAECNVENSRVQGSNESTINTTKAEARSGTPSEFLKDKTGNEESDAPQTAFDSSTFIGDSVPDDKIALDTQEAEGMGRDLSSSSSSDYHGSDSEHNGSDNASTELCDRLDDVHVDRERIMTPILDPARQAMVDRVMEEFWVIFNTRWSSNVRQRAGDSHQESGPSGSTVTYQNTAQSRSTQGKRKRVGDEDDPDRGSDRSDRPPSQSMASGDVATDSPRFACPFRKHDPCRYSIYFHRACALSHWASIARVKY
jgi:hypothetical protein